MANKNRSVYNVDEDALKRMVAGDTTALEKIRKQLPVLANVTAVSESSEYPLINDRTTFYVCKDYVCFPPVNTWKTR